MPCYDPPREPNLTPLFLCEVCKIISREEMININVKAEFYGEILEYNLFKWYKNHLLNDYMYNIGLAENNYKDSNKIIEKTLQECKRLNLIITKDKE